MSMPSIGKDRSIVLVTGAAGFIGFHVARTLRERGIHVVGLDNFNSYYDVRLKRARAAILQQMDVAIVEDDCSKEGLFQELLAKYSITSVIHLAAQAGARYWLKDPASYIRSNIQGFFQLLNACSAHPKIRIIWASSSSVYGSNAKLPFSTEDKTDNPTNLYSATKKSNEVMAAAYHHVFKIPLIGLRFFTVYGPWGRPDMAYYMFTNAINKGEPIKLYNFGKMRRDFTYIDDIVEGVLAAWSSPIEYGIYNLGNNVPEDLEKLVGIIEANLGKKANIQRVPMEPGEMVETFADISSSIKDLGFKPTTTLEEGIGHFINWWRSYPGG